MRLEYYSFDKLEKEIIEIIGRYLDLREYKVFFFGSRVEGRGNERSDIDIGIEGKNPVSVVDLERIREEIDNLPTLYSFDVVDFNRVSDKFKMVVENKKEFIT